MPEVEFKRVPISLPLQLAAALNWLRELGISYSRTRYGRYERILNQVEALRQAGVPVNRATTDLDAAATLAEANELATIHLGLAGKGLDSYLRPRLTILTSGPESYADENLATSSNNARDIGFELAVLARMASAGLQIIEDCGGSDAVTKSGNDLVLFECKRPQSANSVPNAIKKAAHQLERRYRQPGKKHAIGFIALDLTKAFGPALNVSNDPSIEMIASQMQSIMESVIVDHQSAWNRVKDGRTTGVLIRLSRLSWIESGRAMTWIHKHGITPFVGRPAKRIAVVRAVEQAINKAVLSGAAS